eukprot:gene13172-9018_t
MWVFHNCDLGGCMFVELCFTLSAFYAAVILIMYVQMGNIFRLLICGVCLLGDMNFQFGFEFYFRGLCMVMHFGIIMLFGFDFGCLVDVVYDRCVFTSRVIVFMRIARIDFVLNICIKFPRFWIADAHWLECLWNVAGFLDEFWVCICILVVALVTYCLVVISVAALLYFIYAVADYFLAVVYMGDGYTIGCLFVFFDYVGLAIVLLLIGYYVCHRASFGFCRVGFTCKHICVNVSDVCTDIRSSFTDTNGLEYLHAVIWVGLRGVGLACKVVWVWCTECSGLCFRCFCLISLRGLDFAYNPFTVTFLHSWFFGFLIICVHWIIALYTLVQGDIWLCLDTHNTFRHVVPSFELVDRAIGHLCAADSWVDDGECYIMLLGNALLVTLKVV